MTACAVKLPRVRSITSKARRLRAETSREQERRASGLRCEVTGEAAARPVHHERGTEAREQERRPSPVRASLPCAPVARDGLRAITPALVSAARSCGL
jgi:hypothetical protein